MEIYCWDGDWGLPSIDIGCLNVLTHVKFSETPVTIKVSRCPAIRTCISNFPILKKEDGRFIQGTDNILQHFQETGYHPDIGLTPEQYADVISLKALITDKIHPCVTYCLWVDSRNFTEISRPTYAKKCIFPLNFVVPGRLYRNSLDLLHNTKLYGNKTNDIMGEELHLEAVDAINLLSSFLGDKEFFFGDRPTSFDAMLFAYLAPLMKANLASTKLQNHVKACTNLATFVSRILARYFEGEIKSKVKPKADTPKDGSESDYEWVLPVSIATMLMFMYATNIGLLAKLRR